MKHYKKTIIGSIVAFVVGTSCCWLSSIAIWLGGTAMIGIIVGFIESTKSLFILASIILAIISAFLYIRKRRSS